MDIYDVESLQRAFRVGGAPELLLFWGHTAKSSEVGKHVLSQWWPATFTIDGQNYLTVEQFLMAEKARLFGDEATRLAILNATTPSAAKSLGRQVGGFDELAWARQRFDFAVRGNAAKFAQNAVLKDWLVNTCDKVLVEASPVDTIWGIGLAADDPLAREPGRWRGLNLLGFALMQARAQLSR